jgi:hypothetical protein
MSTYDVDVKAARDTATAQAWQAQNARGLYEIYRMFPEIRQSVAVDKLLESYCHPQPVTVPAIMYGLEFGDLARDLQHGGNLWTDAEQRKHFIDIIVNNSKKDPKRKEELRKQLSASVHYNDHATGQRVDVRPIIGTSDLRERAAKQALEIDLRSKSTAEVKEYLASQRPSVEVKKKTLDPTITRAMLISMPRAEYKRLLTRLGGGKEALEIVSERLNGVS